MASITINIASLTFSGHETFILRSNWLKKAYDLLQEFPTLFFLEDAFVRLGVGKNMAQSIRFWGRACNIFERMENGAGHQATELGRALFDDERGWDPFLVTPTSRWLLHWQIVARPEVFTWYYAFNMLRRSEFTTLQLAQQIVQTISQLGGKPPSPATIGRDIDCMLRCYVRPDVAQLGLAAEDALHCPLHELDLIQLLPGQSAFRLVSGTHPDLPDQLVAFAALQQARALGRATVAFNELSYGERSPGRIFRMDEDALLSRLLRFEAITHGQAVYSETGGIRQIAWRAPDDQALDRTLLEDAFAEERRYA
ncbi:MAG TPA: DUF4007 family protein [Roseiflexaceae bacterium]|nr:DUF4007 family protein [Roseiflexaceae bacterium]